MKYDIEFSVDLIDTQADNGAGEKGDIAIDAHGFDIASVFLNGNSYKTFSNAVKAAKRLREAYPCPDFKAVITPMHNIYDDENCLLKGTGTETVEVLLDGTIETLGGWDE